MKRTQLVSPEQKTILIEKLETGDIFRIAGRKKPLIFSGYDPETKEYKYTDFHEFYHTGHVTIGTPVEIGFFL